MANEINEVSISGPAPVIEGGVLTFTLTRTGDLVGALNVNLSTTPGGASSIYDFSAPFNAVFAAGADTAVVTVQTFDDALIEGTESFTLSIQPSFMLPTPAYVVGAQGVRNRVHP